jgi:hypothetical protein
MRIIEIENLYTRSEQDYWATGGRAINWDTPAPVKDVDPTTGGIISYVEEFAPGSILIPAEGVILRDDHGEDVGLLTRSDVTGEGWDVELNIDQTPSGARVRQDLKAKKKQFFSIGFSDIETTFDPIRNVYRRTKALVKEISVTNAPQHLNTGVAFVRSNPQQETDMKKKTGFKSLTNVKRDTPNDQGAAAPTQEPTQAQNATPAPAQGNLLTRAHLDDAIRDLRGELQDSIKTRSMPKADHRSPGEFWRDLARGDDATIKSYENLLKRSYSDRIAAKEQLLTRAFPTEGVYANTPDLPAFVGDLSRLVDEPAYLLNAFSTGPLPDQGMSIEYGAIGTDGTVVDVQDAEGDDLDYGYVDVDLKTAPVITYGGYTRLSRQAIERSSIAFLDTNLRAMALRAGKRINIRMRTALETALAAQVTASRKVSIASGDEDDWMKVTDALFDAVVLLLAEGLTGDTLIVDKTCWKILKNLPGSDGRPLLLLSGNGVNNIGSLNLPGAEGEITGIKVICDPFWTYNPASTPTNNMALVNKEAIRFRNSGITQLTDENIVNLSKDYSLYFYGAIATEIPKGVVPIELTIA